MKNVTPRKGEALLQSHIAGDPRRQDWNPELSALSVSINVPSAK